ncbi:MAG: 2-amino-4-hydroxy-6-hydroxymethyldihydropteridine diphosphokinase [Verrucomicrobia bacterium]|nr:2-amino-4-hydroxy-6-hydroxymethyldihydropteridine diphosphokinase [Verrucomicrobiota bacterium]
MEIGFCLGSNAGDRLQFLRWAKTRLLLSGKATFVGQSSVYETEPVGVRDEYRAMKFLNAVLIAESGLTPQEWLPLIHRIEGDLSRVRTDDRNAPRTIDIDIIFAGDQIVDGETLKIPHPRWAERRFVVQPLAEVRGDLVLPDSQSPVHKILEQMPANDDVRLFAEKW